MGTVHVIVKHRHLGR